MKGMTNASPGVGQFAAGKLGTIKGGTADGSVQAQEDGTGTVVGWSGKASTADVAKKADKTALDATDAKVTQIQTAVGDCFNAAEITSDGKLQLTAVDGQVNSLTLPAVSHIPIKMYALPDFVAPAGANLGTVSELVSSGVSESWLGAANLSVVKGPIFNFLFSIKQDKYLPQQISYYEFTSIPIGADAIPSSVKLTSITSTAVSTSALTTALQTMINPVIDDIIRDYNLAEFASNTLRCRIFTISDDNLIGSYMANNAPIFINPQTKKVSILSSYMYFCIPMGSAFFLAVESVDPYIDEE